MLSLFHSHGSGLSFVVLGGMIALWRPTFAQGEDASGQEPNAGASQAVFQSVELNHLSLNLEKSERAEIFYRTVFGMTPIDHGRRGNDRFLHFQQGFLNMRPASESSINHFCFSIRNYEPDAVFRLAELIDTQPFFMGRSVHCFDPDRFNIQIQEAEHGWGRIQATQLADAANSVFKTVRIHHLSFNVTDLDESHGFYNEVFNTQTVSATTDRVLMRVGDHAFLELLKSDVPGINHYCFAVEDFDATRARTALEGHVHGEITMPEEGFLRFDDPNGIPMEITSPDQMMQ